MDGRRYPRPPSPVNLPGRSSLPVLGYSGYSDSHTIPHRDSMPNPRSSGDRVNIQSPVVTTYKIKPEASVSRSTSLRENSRLRGSTLDSVSGPHVIGATARRPAIHGGADKPGSPISNPYRSSDETGEYYTIPASSGKYRGHNRGAYSATMDNADMNRLTREAGPGGMLRVGSGRDGALYSRSRPMYSGSLGRHHDMVIDDYGDDGYGYTTPGDLVQYDLDRSARYPFRRESFEGSRSGRPASMSYTADLAPRSIDPRERGPPPATRGFGKIASQAPVYDPPPIRVPAPAEPFIRSPRVSQFYETDPLRKGPSRRPVSVYHEPERLVQPGDYEIIRDYDLRGGRGKKYHTKHYDGIDHRGFSVRGEHVDEDGYGKKKEYERRRDYDKHGDYEDRSERRGGRDKVSATKDHEKGKDYEDRQERKKDKVPASLSIAASALGLGAMSQDSRDHERERDGREPPRRRRDDEEHGKRREDEEELMDLTGRDPKERQRDSKDSDGSRDKKEKSQLKGETSEAVDLSWRDPWEGNPSLRDDIAETRERKVEQADDGSKSNAREVSAASDEVKGQRLRKGRGSREGPTVPFNPQDTMDLRALKEAFAKEDATASLSKAKEPIREGSFDRRTPEDRDRRELSRSDDERRGPTPRLVSPPREETKKPEDKPVKGILRQPRERFPEDPMPVREGVAPLKDAKKEGIPLDARWTKISRRMVNPEALEYGKERYEARDDFVIVLRVLSKEEVQAYAEATAKIRAARDEIDAREEERRRRRPERHQRHEHERSYRGTHEYGHDHRRHRKERGSQSESDTMPDDEQPKTRRITYDVTSAEAVEEKRERDKDRDRDRERGERDRDREGVRESVRERTDGLRENPEARGTYIGYVRNPPRKGK